MFSPLAPELGVDLLRILEEWVVMEGGALDHSP
jgi:hypothetical protein